MQREIYLKKALHGRIKVRGILNDIWERRTIFIHFTAIDRCHFGIHVILQGNWYDLYEMEKNNYNEEKSRHQLHICSSNVCFSLKYDKGDSRG